jgi:hypothetical protein
VPDSKLVVFFLKLDYYSQQCAYAVFIDRVSQGHVRVPFVRFGYYIYLARKRKLLIILRALSELVFKFTN